MDYVRRVVSEKESRIFSNRLHASENDITLCGKSLNERWFVMGQCDNSDVTCPTCRRILIQRGTL